MEALEHFELAQKEESSGPNFFNRGLTNMKLGKHEKANSDFHSALEQYKNKNESATNPGQYKVHYNMGINFRQLGQLEKSIESFRAAIDLNEKPCAFNNRGLSYFEYADYSNAVKDFNKAI